RLPLARARRENLERVASQAISTLGRSLYSSRSRSMDSDPASGKPRLLRWNWKQLQDVFFDVLGRGQSVLRTGNRLTFRGECIDLQGFAKLRHNELTFNGLSHQSTLQFLFGLHFAIVRQRKCSEVTSNAHLRTQYAMRFNGLRGRAMHLTHEPFGPVSPDRQDGSANRREAMCDFFKVRSKPGIRAKVNRTRRGKFRGRLDHEGAPQGCVAIERCASGKMLRGRRRQPQASGHGHRVPPIQLLNTIDA